MICQTCKQREATFHYKSSINGQVQERHLCASCAAEAGFNEMFSAGGIPWSSLFSDLIGSPAPTAASHEVCTRCGTSREEIAADGKVGCAHCYSTFQDLLQPYIERIHGRSARHRGRGPDGNGKVQKSRQELERMKKALNAAVELQNYEDAAVLRDKIKELEKEEGNP